ncbi:MAG: RidA family protein [Gammaproteobacteria bacterium]|nr:RidA family protein [Gammaproteobacteria bacterium]
MNRKIITTPLAPSAIGTYSQAVLAGNTLYISGQIPLDPATGVLVEGSFEDRAERVFLNLKAIAQAADMSLGDAVKVTVFLTDLGTFQQLNGVMERHFPAPWPARAAVQVAALPRGTDVEVDAILVRT